MKVPEHRWFSTWEVSQTLRIAPRTILDLARARGIKGKKVGQAWLWHPSILTIPVRRVGRPKKRS